MKIQFLFMFLIISNICISQNSRVKGLLAKINGEWQLNDNIELEYKIVLELDGVSKDELFSRAEN